MNEDAAQFALAYQKMSDSELRLLGSQYDTLIESAQLAVRNEFSRRGMEAPLVEEGEQLSSRGLVTIRQFRDQPEAFIARSVLESAGIYAFLRDENTIRNEWVWSNLMGGIRLQVASEDREAAEAILSQPIPESIAVAGELDYNQPHCPRCQSLDISFETLDLKVRAASMLLLGFPLPSPVNRDSWRCHTCGCSWTDDYENMAPNS